MGFKLFDGMLQSCSFNASSRVNIHKVSAAIMRIYASLIILCQHIVEHVPWGMDAEACSSPSSMCLVECSEYPPNRDRLPKQDIASAFALT